MPITRSAVLCGSHSGDVVPDLHGSVPESGDIEILDLHVSYCDAWTALIHPWVAISMSSSPINTSTLVLGQMFNYSMIFEC